MHKFLQEGIRIRHGEKGNPLLLVRFIEKWHGEHVWFVEEQDGHQHIEVFGLDDYIGLCTENAKEAA